ncbi:MULTISPECIES: ubiquitin-like domain-containing protein [unclassified Actinotalea]|uniref:aggregation-promoting factor C-terminal-like domain-containing protein n=1 Tax=unclassified Actinotalea TaxID=2638618 RepID=UPI0015F6111E|nr:MULTISPECIES: ubiquitin-like domain-containing protein [unclassified Actinotalea]
MPVPHASTAAPARGRWAGRARVAAQAAVLSMVVGGTSAFAVLHKTVTLDVDGEVRTVAGFGRTVEDILAGQAIEVREGDVVAPVPGSLVHDDTEIVVRHAREVVVEIDGERRTLVTTAATVGEVLAELGLREGARASSSRSAPLGRDVLRLSTAKALSLTVDGATRTVGTTASTVRDVLAEAGVVLGEHDQVSVPLDTAATDGLAVTVTRVQSVTRTETTAQPFEVVRQEDPTLPRGQEVVASRGVDGSQVATFVAYEADGVEIGRTLLAAAVTAPPVAQVVRVGTKEPIATPAVAPVEPGTSRAIGLELTLARGWGEDQFACLDALWSKESGWRVDAHNPSSGAHGIPQALPGSKMASVGADWQSNPVTQITWGLGYIEGRYGNPCGAWAHSKAKNWY